MSPSQSRIVWWIAGGLIVFLVFGNQGFRELASNLHDKHRLDKALATLRSEHEPEEPRLCEKGRGRIPFYKEGKAGQKPLIFCYHSPVVKSKKHSQ
jgi:hypothetical protein